MRTMLVAVLALGVLAPTADAARKPSYTQLAHQVRTLKATNVQLRTQRDTALQRASTYSTRIATLTSDKTTLTGQVGSLTTQVTTLTADNTRLAAENTALKGNLPSQVMAVARTGVSADLQSLVLVPAHNGWACSGSVFYGQTFFSFDFNRRAPDGSCY